MTDEFFMKKAIELASRGQGLTSPNPCVGAVFVKNGKIIGSGYHGKAGLDHAEIVAVKDAIKKKNSLKESILYVTLEPCCHVGKTGPCCDEIIRFGVGRVVVAHKDPSGKVNGKGIKILEKAGVSVDVGVMEKEAKILNQPFLKVSKFGVPFVTIKAGMTLDGKISAGNGKSEWITSELSRKHGHEIRDKYDAILVGANTVIIDNPLLSDRRGKLMRIIIDGKLRTSPKARVYRDTNVFVATTKMASSTKVKEFSDRGIKLDFFGKDTVDVDKLLKYLYLEFDIQSVFVEGGGATHGAFVDARAVDDIYLYIAPQIIGGNDSISVIRGKGVSSIKDALKIKKIDVSMLGSDILLHGVVNEY